MQAWVSLMLPNPKRWCLGNTIAGTVKGVYENIEKDLTEGLQLLKPGSWEVPKYHFNPQAAHAFAARFYLFKGRMGQSNRTCKRHSA